MCERNKTEKQTGNTLRKRRERIRMNNNKS